MALFPSIPIDPDKSSVSPEWRTLRLGPTDGDYIQRRRKRTVPLHTFSIGCTNITAAEYATLVEFFNDRSGGFESFSMFDFRAIPRTGVGLGTGDGVEDTFTIPARACSAVAVYINGVLATLTTDYTISVGTGTDGQDRIVFVTPPALGEVITADYTGYRYFEKCIFADDSLPRNGASGLCYSAALRITEVR